MSNRVNPNKTDKLGVMLLALVSVVSIGLGFYAEKNQSSSATLSPQEKLTQSLKDSVAATYPQINDPSLSAWEKVNLLRRWAYQQTDQAMTNDCKFSSPNLRAKSVAEIFSDFQQDKGGVYCGGASIFLMKLYEQYGFKAYALNMGKPSVSKSLTHVLVLVKIPHNGKDVLVVQDGLFNNSYAHLDGSPLDYFELIQLLNNRQLNKIKVVQNHDGERDVLLCKNQIPPDIWEISTKQLDCEQIPGTPDYKCRNKLTLDLFARYSPVQKEVNQFFTAEGLPPNLLYIFLYPLGIEGTPEDAPSILQQAQALTKVQLSRTSSNHYSSNNPTVQ